jgi:hypothetical protein
VTWLPYYYATGPGVAGAGEVEIGPADSLLTAIWRFADADDLLGAAFGRAGWLWKNKAPRGVALPYAVVFEAGSTARTGTGESYFETVLIQFNVFATSEVTAKRLGDLVTDTFAPFHGQEEMVFEGGEDRDRWIEDGNVLERDFARGRGGVPVYVQRVNFGWRVWRSYTPEA